MILKGWLSENQERLGRRWKARIRTREDRPAGQDNGFLDFFLDTLVTFLSPCLGPSREAALEAWHHCTHLYGSYSLRRGLSAGEVVEELELLREEILRLLLESSPGDFRDRRLQNEILSLNQTLDAGVVRASVAYVDDLFFAHLSGSGVPEGITQELEDEIRRQLQTSQEDFGS